MPGRPVVLIHGYSDRESRGSTARCAFATTTFGSPIAHKGRSWLGVLFKGRRELGPDFLEASDETLRFASVIGDEAVRFFYPFTTTLVELRLNREPLTLQGATGSRAF